MSPALNALDPNAPVSTNNNAVAAEQADNDKKVMGMDYHRQMLQQRLEKEGASENKQYISPSDTILSPCTQKLRGFKEERLGRKLATGNKGSGLLFAKHKMADRAAAEAAAGTKEDVAGEKGTGQGEGLW